MTERLFARAHTLYTQNYHIHTSMNSFRIWRGWNGKNGTQKKQIIIKNNRNKKTESKLKYGISYYYLLVFFI